MNKKKANIKIILILGLTLLFIGDTKLLGQSQNDELSELTDAVDLQRYGTTKIIPAGNGEIIFLINSNDDIILYHLNSNTVIAEFNFEGHINAVQRLANGNVICIGSSPSGGGIIKIYTALGLVSDSLELPNEVPMAILIKDNVFYFGTENGTLISCNNSLEILWSRKLKISGIYDLEFIGSDILAMITANEIYSVKINDKSEVDKFFSCDSCSFFKMRLYKSSLYFASYSNLFIYDLKNQTYNIISSNNGEIVDFFFKTEPDELYITTNYGVLLNYDISDLRLKKRNDLYGSKFSPSEIAKTEATKSINSYVLCENFKNMLIIDTLFKVTDNTCYLELVSNNEVLIGQTNGKFMIYYFNTNSTSFIQSKNSGVISMSLTNNKKEFLVSLDNKGWSYWTLPEFKTGAAERSSHKIISAINTNEGLNTVAYYNDLSKKRYQFEVSNKYFNPKQDIPFNVTYIDDTIFCSKFSSSKNKPLLTLQVNGSFKIYNKFYLVELVVDSIQSYANNPNSNKAYLLKENKQLISISLDKLEERFVLDFNILSSNCNVNCDRTQMEVSDNGQYIAILIGAQFYVIDLKLNVIRSSVNSGNLYSVSDFAITDKGSLIYSIVEKYNDQSSGKELQVSLYNNVNSLFNSYYDIHSNTLYLIENNGNINSVSLENN